MHFGYIEDLLSDPRSTLIFLLLALPGRLLAISCHEAAHAYVANRCGDPTARLMGRMTLNPFKHLDPVGVLMMLLLGIGWAKPVPVNPLNFREYRKDDLKVALAGIAMNIFLFCLGYLVLCGFMALALSKIPYRAMYWLAKDDVFRSSYNGVSAIFLASESGYCYSLTNLVKTAYSMGEVCVAPVFGSVFGYLYEMIYYFVMTNLVLAIFNLIPVPPLDGYHVLNDLALKRPLFADQRAQGVGMAILYVASFSGVLGDLLGKVYEFVLSGLGGCVLSLFQAVKLI